MNSHAAQAKVFSQPHSTQANINKIIVINWIDMNTCKWWINFSIRLYTEQCHVILQNWWNESENATCIGDNWDLNNVEKIGKIKVSTVEGAPAGNNGNAGLEKLTLLGQSNGLDITAKVGKLLLS